VDEKTTPTKIDHAMKITLEAQKKIIYHFNQRTHGNREITNYLRIGVRTTGCSGYAYVLDYAEADTVTEEDIQYPYESFTVVVDKQSAILLVDIELGYKTENLGERFTFNNPQEAARCGCGESFTVKNVEAWVTPEVTRSPGTPHTN
jgi:iron-sulfur cluster assembly protein